MQESILILDFGSQFTQLIARRVRELNVYCEIHPYNHAEQAFEKHAQHKRGNTLGQPFFSAR